MGIRVHIRFPLCINRTHYALIRAIELANSIATVEQPAVPDVHRSSLFHAESIQYYVGKSLFDLREFRRAAHALIDCKSDEAFFLRSYSLYFVSANEYVYTRSI